MTAIGMLLSLHLCFLYYVDGNHRDLPSFPTRRSSDLARSAGCGARGQGTSATLPEKPLLRFYGGIARTATRDRKSTRLNSSHVSISYAVFCLKKKNGRAPEH